MAHHHHGHVHTDDARRLTIALVLILGLMAVELVAGVLAVSLALLSDAAHLLTDAGAIALALFTARLAQRPASGGFTFGFRRAEILSAQVNGATLRGARRGDRVEGVRRLVHPPDVEGRPVLVVAIVGIVVNLAATLVLAGSERRSLNVEGAFQHVLTDLFAFIATAIAGVVVLTTDFTRADGIAALFVAALMLRSGYGLLRDSGRVLLEAAPRGPRPGRDRPRARRPEPRGGGARPARVGGHLGLPRDLGPRDGARRLRHAVAPARARRAAARALRDLALDAPGGDPPRGAADHRAARAGNGG